jgi:hypothetical protein
MAHLTVDYLAASGSFGDSGLRAGYYNPFFTLRCFECTIGTSVIVFLDVTKTMV